jgi:hypothetical protein
MEQHSVARQLKIDHSTTTEQTLLEERTAGPNMLNP